MTDMQKAVESAARAYSLAYVERKRARGDQNSESAHADYIKDALTAALPFLAPKPSESDEETARTIVLRYYGTDEAGFDAPGLQQLIARALAKRAEESARAEREACIEAVRAKEVEVWREAANHCLDVPKGHLPDYFNSIADEAERAAIRSRTPGGATP